MRTSEVVAAAPISGRTEKGSGAGLRVSGGKRTNELAGDAPWTRLTHEFRVERGVSEVEIICELRAEKGEAWFKAESLRLLRQ